MNNDKHKELEQFIHNQLRALPQRRAPRTLEHRVFAALAEREALPWYRRSFSHWPSAARAAFYGTCILALALLMAASLGANNPLLNAAPQAGARLSLLGTILTALQDSGQLLLRSIPTAWIYGALAGVAALYFAIFGLGATAYRTLLSNR